MSSKTISLEDFEKELGKFSKNTLKEQKKAVIRGLQRSMKDLAEASPVDLGFYAASWDFKVDEKNAVIGNYAPYAGIIEHGSRPFTPPIGPLLGWAKRVLRDPSQSPHYSSAVWALAKYTQKKISDHGMQPRHILENMMPKILENIKEELKRAA